MLLCEAELVAAPTTAPTATPPQFGRLSYSPLQQPPATATFRFAATFATSR
jgi:hypothetical protein